MRLHSTVLLTCQLAPMREFYTGILGFSVTDDFGACIVLNCGLSIWQPGAEHPVQPSLQGESRGAGGETRFPFELCFEADTADEFEALATTFARSGLRLLHAVRTEPWGQRTLRLQDPDGNLVEWGESIPCFVRRLFAESGDAAHVANTTGVPEEQVRRLVGTGGN